MAIVEDEVRNESEEENEIEVVVEEDDGDQDSDDSDDDDDEEVLEKKVTDLEQKIAEDPYNYDQHIELIQALWRISALDRWRAAWTRLSGLSSLRPAHWLLRLRAETSLAHTAQDHERLEKMFHDALLDGYCGRIVGEWCGWAGGLEAGGARRQLTGAARVAGADPLHGRLVWEAKLALEQGELHKLSADHAQFSTQRERVLRCLEELLSRPLLHARTDTAINELTQLAGGEEDYIQRVETQREAAAEFLLKVTPFEDKLLVTEDAEQKLAVYMEYISEVKRLACEHKYKECECDAILSTLYDRATTECSATGASDALLDEWSSLARDRLGPGDAGRVLAACAQRRPHSHEFWLLLMQHAEGNDQAFDEVKGILEKALGRVDSSYSSAERLWLGWLEHVRRRTDFTQEADRERLRRNFRLAWDSLAEAWGAMANDCEIPLFWARLEYRRLGDAQRGKEVIEETFRYGENKTMSKYWETLATLESGRSPPPPAHKLRDLYRRALRHVTDYPPAVARAWTDHERDYGTLASLQECSHACEVKLKQWREDYQAMKEKMTGQKQKGKQTNKTTNKKTKDNKRKRDDTAEEKPKNKGKRKSDESETPKEVKRKRDGDMEVDTCDKDGDSGGVKRSHEGDHESESHNKRARRDSTGGSRERVPAGKEACTLFVSNLDFRVDEEKLRHKLSEWGEVAALRVKSNVKHFGGSIAYCQYQTPESVDTALQHDRALFNNRPMFLSRYNAKEQREHPTATAPAFKYATTTERNKLFVRNLPFSHCTQDKLREVFQPHGDLKDVRIVTHKDGRPKGLAYIEYKDEQSAAAALKATDGQLVGDRHIVVAISAPPPRAGGSGALSTLGGSGASSTLGQPKTGAPGGSMKRTQLSSFIPRVLQTPSTSVAGTSGVSAAVNGQGKPKSNSDFRAMLLNK